MPDTFDNTVEAVAVARFAESYAVARPEYVQKQWLAVSETVRDGYRALARPLVEAVLSHLPSSEVRRDG